MIETSIFGNINKAVQSVLGYDETTLSFLLLIDIMLFLRGSVMNKF